MTGWRKQAGLATLSGAILGAAVLGVDLFHNAQFAQAEQRVDANRQELATIEDSSTVYREIHSVVEPSVVEIQVEKTVNTPQAQLPQGFQRFFHQFGDNGMPGMPPDFFNLPNQGGTQHESGTGSGVIMEAANGYGYILTNNHVAGGATEMRVVLNDGRVIKDAQVVGADPHTDLAVVKIKADHLIPARWGDSTKLETGDTILAFGAPFGYVGSMTHGIVSALHRQAGILGTDGIENFIQVDAPINPGNSGGPLVDLHGDVVGINTAIASSSGGFQGIGFAIPSEEARPIFNQLKTSGKVTRGWLGLEIQNVSSASDEAASDGYDSESGVLVHEVLKSGPSASELRPGDIITKLDGRPVADSTDLISKVAFRAPGSEVKLSVFRDGKYQDVTVKIGAMPTDRAALAGVDSSAEQPHGATSFGLQMQNVTPDLAQRYGWSDKTGAVVTAVEPNSPAAQAGIHVGDVITRVNRHDVRDASEAESALKKSDLKSGVRLQLDSSEGSELVFVKGGLGE